MIPLLAVLLCCTPPQSVDATELTISGIHEKIRSGELTCRALVEAYVGRIEAYDQETRLNAIVVVNPKAIARADELDAEFKRTGTLRRLHGIPIIVKDNYDTVGLPTTAGSLALKGSIAPDDAFQVRKLKEAGAIVLAKSNMAEWAFSPMRTESSIAGITRNPYDLSRVPAGSSGGTGAAVAANFGAVGLGTDTGNSIRGPSSHNGLVGIRSTMGLTSRDGIIPLSLRNDIGGPMARTVEDAVRVFEVLAGYDAADPITEKCRGKVPENYRQFLLKDGLKGAKIGVFRRYIDDSKTDSEIRTLMAKAIADLKAQGAEIVDPLDLPRYDELLRGIGCNTFRHDLNAYLATLGPNAPVKTLKDVIDSGLYLPRHSGSLNRGLREKLPASRRTPPRLDVYRDPKNIAFREALLDAMKEHGVDAIVYPTWSNPPRKIGDRTSPAGDNSQYLSPHSGLPAITVPIGFTRGSLPAGMTFVGKLFGEPDLIRYVYAYEQATRHRRPPEGFGRSR